MLEILDLPVLPIMDWCTLQVIVLFFSSLICRIQSSAAFVNEWENGYKIVIGIKSQSKESKLLYFIRKCYYSFIKRISEVDHINQFDGFGLYDASFIQVLKSLQDPLPYLRGIVAELGYKKKEVFYTQEKRKYGKTSFNFYRLYDQAMLGITSYSKVVLRLATLIGFFVAILSLLIAMFTFVYKLFNWESFPIDSRALRPLAFFSLVRYNYFLLVCWENMC